MAQTQRQATDAQIYKLWLSKVHDNRYLRPQRWAELLKVIEKFRVKTVIEFGCGVSTLLMGHRGIRVDTYETDPFYLDFVKSLNPPNVLFHLHNNVNIDVSGTYDMALVDGVLPRQPQLKAVLPLTRLIAIDDFGPLYKRELVPLLGNHTRLNPGAPLMAIFKIE
jgi:hypothetical protein